MDLTSIISADKSLLLTLNGSDNLFADGLALSLTNAYTWIPLYVALFYMVMKNNDSLRQIILITALAGICVLLAGTINDSLVKPNIGRWRPTHDSEIGTLVDVVDGYRGGRFGFFSSHAANTLSVAIFFCLLVRSRSLSVILILWALVNSWTRIYLGVHFPLDVACGLLWGTIVGFGVYFFYKSVFLRLLPVKSSFISSKYTSSGYVKADIDVVESILALTLVYCVIKACIVTL